MVRDDGLLADERGGFAWIGAGVTAGDQNFWRNGRLVAAIARNVIMDQTRWIADGWRVNSLLGSAPNGLAALGRRGLCDAARVDDLQVSRGASFGGHETAFAQERFDFTRLGVVDPAAECADSIGQRTHASSMLVGVRDCVSGRDRLPAQDSERIRLGIRSQLASRCCNPFAIIQKSRRFGAFASQRSAQQDSEYPTPWQ